MSIDPKILKRLQGEDAFQQSQTRGARRVKIEKGHNWTVRFLPAKMGPDELWFARIAKHWVNKQPIVCPRNTGADYGGDPEAHCPICELSAELNDSSDKIISKIGYDAKSSSQYLTWCIVVEKDGVAQTMAEILNPYEFWHYPSTWEELKGFYVAGGRKQPDSVLDYERGNDFSINRTLKTTRLDKLDAMPIFDIKEPKWDEYIKKLEAAMKTPKVQLPDARQLEVFSAKLQAAAERAGEGSDEAPPARRRAPVDEDEAPAPRRRAPVDEDEAPAPRRRAHTDEGEGTDLGPVSGRAPVDEDEAPPARRRAPVDEDEAPAPRRRAPMEDPDDSPRRHAPVEDPDEPRARQRAAAATEDDDDESPAPRHAASRAPAEPEEAAPSARRALEPTARRAAASVESQDDEDNLPEDDKDNVPPAAKVVTEDDAPTPVARRGQPAGKAVNERLNRLGTKA